MKKNIFESPYAGIGSEGNMAILYGHSGSYSAIIAMENPVLQYGADAKGYEHFQALLCNVVKLLGEGYLVQKQDVFSRQKYVATHGNSLMQAKYNAHFDGRSYTALTTYLILTRSVKRGAFYTYDKAAFLQFLQNCQRVTDLLEGAQLSPRLLDEGDVRAYVSKYSAMDFTGAFAPLNNIRSGDEQLSIGPLALRSMSLVDTDRIDLPESIAAYQPRSDEGSLRDFPNDHLSFLFRVPDFKTIIYNQVIEIPSQRMTLSKLELKRKRHAGVPDPANQICIRDIDDLLKEVADENRMLVQAHFNLLISASAEKIDKACNFVAASLFGIGIIPSSNAYNQMELFRSAFPGNAVALQNYDYFLTSAEAATSLFFKERLPRDEASDFLIRFTDRQGLPIGIDPADLPMKSGRINNRSKFVLGGSGSGKSFFMNALLEQYMAYNFDIVIVDVGHSYSGLCRYFQGKYFTYTEEHPITMNPFFITPLEYNLEKKDFLKTLLALLLKGAKGVINQVEDSIFSDVISAFYGDYFSGKLPQGTRLDFNAFYHYSLGKIAEIKRQDKVSFDLDEYRYVLRKFCTGGEYGRLLNEQSDNGVFSERFIVYEIDSIRENAVLFPIVTLIIMDVVLQKMRHRTLSRKALVLEEAWKAIASPMMAGYITYLCAPVKAA